MTTNFTCASGYAPGSSGAPTINCKHYNATVGKWSTVSGSCVGKACIQVCYLIDRTKHWVFIRCFYFLAICPTSISSPYVATIPNTPIVGTVVNVSCVAGYVWNVAPYSGVEPATCVTGSPASWSVSGGAQCVGNFEVNSNDFIWILY